jgi:ABC-type transporter Mla MlaB component
MLRITPSPSYGEEDVLKITEITRIDSTKTFKLEGKLLGPWLDELRSICMQSIQRSEQISLDLAAVTFVDGAGASLMGELIRQGVTITQCSGFVAELLHVKKK